MDLKFSTFWALYAISWLYYPLRDPNLDFQLS